MNVVSATPVFAPAPFDTSGITLLNAVGSAKNGSPSEPSVSTLPVSDEMPEPPRGIKQILFPSQPAAGPDSWKLNITAALSYTSRCVSAWLGFAGGFWGPARLPCT